MKPKSAALKFATPPLMKGKILGATVSLSDMLKHVKLQNLCFEQNQT